MTDVAFIGIGTMGGPMAERVLSAGHSVVVNDLDRDAAAGLEADGATWAARAPDAVDGASVICLSLPGPRQVEDVLLGADGVLDAATPGAVVVDHTTNSIETVHRVAARCADLGLGFVDAPVSGGRAGAAAGTLAVMCGGAEADVDAARPVLAAFGDPIVHLGAVGAGTIAKLVNNQVFLCGEIVFQEGLVLAAKAGIDPAAMLSLLGRTGAGGAHVANGERVVRREFEGPGFALALAEKDVALAIAAGRALGVPMPASASAHQRFIESVAEGLGHERSFATLRVIERSANHEVPRVEPNEEDDG